LDLFTQKGIFPSRGFMNLFFVRNAFRRFKLPNFFLPSSVMLVVFERFRGQKWREKLLSSVRVKLLFLFLHS